MVVRVFSSSLIACVCVIPPTFVLSIDVSSPIFLFSFILRTRIPSALIRFAVLTSAFAFHLQSSCDGRTGRVTSVLSQKWWPAVHRMELVWIAIPIMYTPLSLPPPSSSLALRLMRGVHCFDEQVCGGSGGGGVALLQSTTFCIQRSGICVGGVRNWTVL